MKKILLVALAVGLMYVWAAPAMAVEWSAFGGFTVSDMFYKNIDFRVPVLIGGIPGSGRFAGGGTFGPADPAWNRQNWWLQMRGNIYVIARASADLQGVFGIEVNSTRFGEADAAATTGGFAGKWNADAVAIQVKSMYIDFKVPGIPDPLYLRMKVGIQPFQLRNPVFLYVDAAGISANVKIPIDPVLININPFWAVMSKGGWAGVPTAAGAATDQTTADDGNFFGVDVNAVIGDIKPGVFFAMQRQGQIYDSPIGEGDRNLWWLGLYTDATFGSLAVTADFIYNGGYDHQKKGFIVANAFDLANPPYYATVSAHSIRHEAFLTRGVVSYTMNKLKFGIGGLYGTGDDPTTRDKQEGFMVPWRSEEAFFNDDFVVLTGNWGLRQPFATQTVGGLFKEWATSGQGVWYVRGFADYAVADWLKLKVNAGYIGDTARHADEFGTDNNDDKSIGWELDAGVQINIYKNLYFDNAFGYLIGGKALLSQAGGFRAQDPWAFESVLTYLF